MNRELVQAFLDSYTVHVLCPVCQGICAMVYDHGYPATRQEPAVPPAWYTDHPCAEDYETKMELSVRAVNTPEYRAYELAESKS